MRRIHYAWILLLLVFVAIAAGTGVRLAFGSFVNPWEHDFGVTRGVTSTVGMFSFIAYGIGQPVLGRIADKRGAGGVLAAAMGMVAFGLVLSFFARSIWTVGLAYGLVASFGFAGTSHVIGSVAVTRWFRARRGLAMGILALAGSIGQMVLMPLSIHLNTVIGWRETVLIYAVALAVLLPLVYWLVKPSPEATGMLPYGAAAGAGTRVQPGQRAGAGALRQVVARRDFWFLAIPYFICGLTTVGLVHTHLVPYATDRQMPEHTIELAMILMAAGNSVGGTVSGYLSDRIPRSRLLAGLFSIRILAFLILILVPDPRAMLVFATLAGLVDMATIAPTTGLAAQLLGDTNVGMVYGLISLCHQFGGAAGSFLPGQIYDLTGSYQTSFVAAVGILVVAVLVSLQIRERPGHGARAQAAG